MATEECIAHIDNITVDRHPYMLLFYLNPVPSRVWEPRSTTWMYIFKAYSAIFSLLFFMVGVLSIIIAIKRNCHRLKTKTFIVVYTCLAIFGISRGLHLAIDPHGIIGWLIKYFPEWTIISRVLAATGFPSFSIASVLVFITLYKSTEMSTSRLWHQDWRVIIAIVIVNYSIAIVAEAIANSAAHPAIFSIIACSAVFSIWGMITCVIYIFAGSRLLFKLKKQHVKSMRMSASFSDDKGRRLRQKHRAQSSEDIFYNESYQKKYDKISQTVRKITIITFFTAVMGVIYSLLNLVALFFTTWIILFDCIGLNGQGDPVVWLTLQITLSTVELPLVIIILYSVTDITGMMKKFCCCCGSTKIRKASSTATSQTGSDSGLSSSALSTSPLPQLNFYPPLPSVSPPPNTYKIIDLTLNTNDILNVKEV